MKNVFKLLFVLFILATVGMILISGCASPQVTAAKVYIQQNNLDKAIERATLAVEQNPNDAEAYYVLGQAYGLKDQFREMNQAFDKSLEISPKYAVEIDDQKKKFWQNLFAKGVLSIKQNKLELALEQF